MNETQLNDYLENMFDSELASLSKSIFVCAVFPQSGTAGGSILRLRKKRFAKKYRKWLACAHISMFAGNGLGNIPSPPPPARKEQGEGGRG